MKRTMTKPMKRIHPSVVCQSFILSFLLFIINRPCLLTGALVLVPISAHDCEVTGALHGAGVGRSWSLTYKDMTLIYLLFLPFQRVIDSPCAVFKKQGLNKAFLLYVSSFHPLFSLFFLTFVVHSLYVLPPIPSVTLPLHPSPRTLSLLRTALCSNYGLIYFG